MCPGPTVMCSQNVWTLANKRVEPAAPAVRPTGVPGLGPGFAVEDVLRHQSREHFDAVRMESAGPQHARWAAVGYQIDAHHGVVPVAVVPCIRLVGEVVNVPVPDLEDAPAHQGSRLRVEVSPVIAYLLVRIHGLSMWVGSSRSEGLMHCYAAESESAQLPQSWCRRVPEELV